ncbi:MAG: hypothetical protein R6U98_11220 [Pirellulaceae bacterium]
MSHATAHKIFDDVEPPVFVRSACRRSDWETKQQILKDVFEADSADAISVWRIENDSDLMRIAVAINANRVAGNPDHGSIRGELFLVAIQPHEVGAIKLEQNEGRTDCVFAKHRHYDAVIEDESQRTQLVDLLLDAERSPKKVTKGQIREAVEKAEKDSCYAVAESSTGCECEKGCVTVHE